MSIEPTFTFKSNVDVDVDIDVDDVDVEGPVPAEALGENVIIEWNFVSDSSADSFSGLSIDDINVIE